MRSSLRFRLALGALLWSLGALLLASASFAAALRSHIERRAARILGASLDELSSAPHSLPRDLSATGTLWQVESSGRCVNYSRELGGRCLTLPGIEDGRVHLVDGPGGEALLALARRVAASGSPEGRRYVVAASLDSLDAEHFVFDRSLLIALSLGGAALLSAGALSVRQGLLPLGKLRTALGSVRRGESTRLQGEYPGEVQPLVDDLNGLLAHSEELVARARAQAGNLAHGLKTPLAILANEAERLLGSSLGSTAETLREQVRIMERHIDGQLARARAAAAGQSIGLRSEVAPSVEKLVRTMSRLYQSRVLAIDARAESSCAFRGESVDLEEILGNLLDNACKWARTRVRVSAHRERDRLAISVDDDGPGLPPDAQGQAFQRGARLDEAKPGSGLGLAIARDLAELYGGSVELVDSELGGLRVEVQLPAA